MHNHIIENTVLSIVEHLVHKENRRSDKNKKVNTFVKSAMDFSKRHTWRICVVIFMPFTRCVPVTVLQKEKISEIHKVI